MYLKLMSPLHAAICTTISYTLWVEWYYLKNNYLTLRSKVKVPRMSLWYETHCLMVMHPPTKYHWPISKDKNVMARTRKYYLKNNYVTLMAKVKVSQRSLRYATHSLMVMHPRTWMILSKKPEALKSLYSSPGYKKNQLVLCKNYVLQWYSSWNYDQHKKHKVCKGPSNDWCTV